MSDQAEFYADVPFHKSAHQGSGDLVLKGYASTWTLDRDQEYVERDAFDGTIEKFLGTNPILLWQHDLEKPIGVVKGMSLDDNGLDVEAFIPRPDDREPDWTHLAYNKVKSGIVKTFSIGGFFNRIHKGAQRAISKVDLFEVSVVSVPSNPDSIFAAAVKSVAGGRRPELTGAHMQQMAMLIGMQPVSDPEIAVMSADEKYARYEFLCEIYRKTGKLPPAYDAWEKVVDGKGRPVLDRLDRVLSLKAMVDGMVFSEKDSAAVAVDVPGDEVIGGIEETVREMKDVLLGDDNVKKGRVLSRANEQRLRRMRDEIDTILAQIRRDSEQDEEDDENGDGKGRLALDTKARPTNLRAGTDTESCSNCQFWRAPTGGGDNGFCEKFNFPTTGDQLSDGFEAKGG